MRTQSKATNDFRRMRDLANLCDLVEIELEQCSAERKVSHQLGEILARVAAKEFTTYDEILLSNLCEARFGISTEKLDALSSVLLSDTTESKARVLRELSRGLHSETAKALARLRNSA